MSNTYTPQSALPSGGVPATGEFTPTLNVAPNTYDESTGNSDAPYNETLIPLIGDASDNLVGSDTKPYLPMALPTYIPTLYRNVFDIQTNLKNIIDPNIVQADNREYPTSFAVKNYVNSVLFGTETLVPTSGGEPKIVSTGVTTTACEANEQLSSPNVIVTNVGDKTYYTTFFDIANIDNARSGATKNIICITDLANTSTQVLNMQIRLTGDKFFLVNGKTYDTYSFVAQGDALTMIQFLNGDNSIFYVITYGGSFSTNN
jgi:hypothetical protein